MTTSKIKQIKKVFVTESFYPFRSCSHFKQNCDPVLKINNKKNRESSTKTHALNAIHIAYNIR